MITLKIEASNAEELLEHVRGLHQKMLNQFENAQATQAQATTGPALAQPTPPAPTEKKTTKKTAKAVETPAGQEQADPAQTTSEHAVEASTDSAPVTKTKEDVAKALQDLTASKDLAKAKEVLGRFKNAAGANCARMSDLQPKDYEDFINTCEAESK